MTGTIQKIAIVGAGVIGSGWAARALAAGLDVVAWDPGPGAEAAIRASVENAWPALTRVGLAAGASLARLGFVGDLADAVGDADFIQESAPENDDLKRRLMAQIDAAARPDAIIASSSSGLLPSGFQADCSHPERVVVGHPFNPVYLLPLVEVLGGAKTAPWAIDAAAEFYTSIGMRPLKVRTEIPGYIADRLQEALWRELLHLVADGVATTAEIDDSIRFGPGLRWAFMGTSLIYHLAGGEQGMRHMLAQFGPALKLPWTRLEAPELTDALIDRMAEGTMAQAAGRSIKELERYRDDALISIQETLRQVKARHGFAADE
jgi:carnitine 3-dehydrogenase